MKFFDKQEISVIALIFGLIAFVSFFNFRTSLRRQRDSERKNDLGEIHTALDKYFNDFGAFPPSSSDGKIIACLPPVGLSLSPCMWGKDSLRDVSDPKYSPYMVLIPIDPQAGQGAGYLYISDGKRYQIYASLEGKDEVEYDAKIVVRNLKCGERICNFGRAFGNTPLDKSLEEYENELLRR